MSHGKRIITTQLVPWMCWTGLMFGSGVLLQTMLIHQMSLQTMLLLTIIHRLVTLHDALPHVHNIHYHIFALWYHSISMHCYTQSANTEIKWNSYFFIFRYALDAFDFLAWYYLKGWNLSILFELISYCFNELSVINYIKLHHASAVTELTLLAIKHKPSNLVCRSLNKVIEVSIKLQ